MVFAYGAMGTALHGKIFFNVLTAGGPEAAYCAEGYNHFTIRELLQPLEQTAVLCGMVYLPPVALFGARTAVDEDRFDDHVADWMRLLKAMRDNDLNIQVARDMPILNADLNAIIRGAET